MKQRQSIAVVHTSRELLPTVKEQKPKRLQELSELGFECTEFEPKHPSENGYTAGHAVERAALLSHALTNRKFDTIWCARGGYGATAMIPFLENMLPPAIPDKTLIGFSDVSFIGCYLATRYPNLRYIHGNHAFDKTLFTGDGGDRDTLFSLIRGKQLPDKAMKIEQSFELNATRFEGTCVPINLSLGESLSAVRQFSFPENTILFIEDLNEDVYRILRKVDSLRNSGLLDRVKAIVVGNFTDCNNADDVPESEPHIAQLIAKLARKPTFYAPFFGHDAARHPLVFGAIVKIDAEKRELLLGFEKQKSDRIFTNFSPTLERPELKRNTTVAHFTGIGGTGMAAVAGLFTSAGFKVEGSDGPIYPPMSNVIASLGIKPAVGYKPENIEIAKPDFVVLSNVISRVGADLKPNPELEHLLTQNIPIQSFPSALRKYFLHKSTNIIVSGTHGKTTTTSIIAQALSHGGHNPSFFVGGSPKNFDNGFRLGDPNLFVLEGDEYDTAFFDKGPKFLHYEPSIALINNIEFDHADIYANVEAIEEEFLRLARITKERGGIVVANMSDERVARVVKRSNARCIAFGEQNTACPHPLWAVQGFKTEANGSIVTLKAPDGKSLAVRTQMFGKHNALNAAATLAVLQAHKLLQDEENFQGNKNFVQACNTIDAKDFAKWEAGIASFEGVRRRFELVNLVKDIAVFDDFAHHPTAIDTTLKAFKDYMAASQRTGRLIACFDPRNATMRRRVLQNELSRSFTAADLIFFGKVPVDQRIAEDDVLDGPAVAKACGANASYFSDNEMLCEELFKTLKPGDTVVFMSSGSFDNLPRKLSEKLASQNLAKA